MSTVRLDHVSFGVRDARACAARLRQTLGATPVAGEVLHDFRWVMFYLGTANSGGRLEIMEPVRDGFLTRFLEQHGDGPHHLTFMVDDLKATVEKVRDLGLTVVGENYGFAPWEEAFIFPDERLGVVVQLAQSSRRYPDAAELVSSEERHPDRYPASRDAKDVNWWTPVWEVPPGPTATLAHPILTTKDSAFARQFFGDLLLGARTTDQGRHVERFTWPGGTLQLTPHDAAGIDAVELSPNSASVTIGTTRIGPPVQ